MITKKDIREKELRLFLEANNISFKDIVESNRSTWDGKYALVLPNTEGIYSSSNWAIVSDRTKKEVFRNNMAIFDGIVKKLRALDEADVSDNTTIIIDFTRLNTTLAKTNQAMKGKNFKTTFTPSTDYGGFTAKRNAITILYKCKESDKKKREFLDEYCSIVPGINYHELGHTYYTISFKRLAKIFETVYFTEFDKNVYTPEKKKEIVAVLLRFANAFEDGRMENLMCEKFPGAYPYFASTIYNFLYKQIAQKKNGTDGEWIDEVDCILFSTRKYIDLDIRKWIFAEYMNNNHGGSLEKAQRVAGYVNKYITLSWRKNLDEMVRLVIGFYLEFGRQLLEDKAKLPKNQLMKELSKLLEKMLGDMASSMNQMEESDELSSGEGDDGEESENNGLNAIILKIAGEKGKKSNKKDPGAGDGKDEEQGDECSGAGTDIQKLKDKALDKASTDKKNSGASKKATSDNLQKASKGNKLKYETYTCNERIVSACMRREQRKLEDYFRSLTTFCRNGYAHKRKSGIVDVPEVRRQSKHFGTKVFRKYRRNMDKAFDVDIAFLLDNSSSMHDGGFVSCNGHHVSSADKAAEQLWISFRSCEAIGGQHKTFVFSSGPQGVLAPASSPKHFRAPHPAGGTSISQTMVLALSYLETSSANNKWLVALTDGEISDVDQQNELLDTAKRMGITTAKINLGYIAEEKSYDHVFTVMPAAHNGNDIVGFFRKVYEISMRRCGVRI